MTTTQLPTNNTQSGQRLTPNLLERFVRNGTWLEKQHFPPLQYAVPGILPEGYCLLAGPPKVGKSWLVANIATACATGGHTFGCIKSPLRKVLYFALEDGDRRLQTRFRKVSPNGTIPEHVNRVLAVPSLEDLLAIARQFLKTCDQPPVIVVDTLGRISPGRTSSQSHFEADYQLGATLQKLAQEWPGTTVLAVHHTNKGEHSDFMNSVSGTQGVTGACDAVLVLSRARGERDAIISVSGRDLEQEAEYAMSMNDGRWELMGGSLEAARDNAQEVRRAQRESDNEKRYGDMSRLILQTLRDSDSPLAAKSVAEAVGIPNDKAGTYLRRLEKAGKAEKVERGLYKYVYEVY